jgi:hypothetical protein
MVKLISIRPVPLAEHSHSLSHYGAPSDKHGTDKVGESWYYSNEKHDWNPKHKWDPEFNMYQVFYSIIPSRIYDILSGHCTSLRALEGHAYISLMSGNASMPWINKYIMANGYPGQE